MLDAAVYNYEETARVWNRFARRPFQEGASFRVHYWGADERLASNPVHRHSFFEICYVIDGQGIYAEGGQTYPLHAGVLFCSRPGFTHQIRTEHGLSILFVAFELDTQACSAETLELFRELAHTPDFYKTQCAQAQVIRLWEALVLQSGQPALPAPAYAAAAGALLMALPMAFGQSSGRLKRMRSSAGAGAEGLLQRAKLYVRDNLAQPLRLPEVAQSLNVSERHLSRLFSAGIHENFTNYVRQERMRAAIKMLLETDQPIKSIAELTGFGSVHYFTRTFTKTHHISPASYRRLYRQA